MSRKKINASMHCIDDEERIRKLIEQAEGETQQEYRERTAFLATGTHDPAKQKRQRSLSQLSEKLRKEIEAMSRDPDSKAFLDRIMSELEEFFYQLEFGDDSGNRKSWHSPLAPMSTRFHRGVF